MAGDAEQLTVLIDASRQGDRQASDRLFRIVYDELRAIARRSRYVGREGETMQPTALANEAYIIFERRFPVPPSGEPANREVFFRVVGLAMRTILRDYWRTKNAAKRGGGKMVVTLGEHQPADHRGDEDLSDVDFLTLDDALDRLEKYNQRWSDVIMHRYFAGRSIDETAKLMGVGVTKIKQDWQLARAWLRREIEG